VVALNESEILVPEPLLPPVTPVSTTVQEKVVPGTSLLKATGRTEPAQIVWFEGVAVITGIGFTVIVAVIGLPTQPLAVGVIV
jgi:hypothetical protein